METYYIPSVSMETKDSLFVYQTALRPGGLESCAKFKIYSVSNYCQTHNYSGLFWAVKCPIIAWMPKVIWI